MTLFILITSQNGIRDSSSRNLKKQRLLLKLNVVSDQSPTMTLSFAT